MKQENLIALIRELNELDELHTEYIDDNIHYVIDSNRDENGTLHFSIKIKDHTDKIEFQDWVKQLDDDMFQEVWEKLSEEHGLQTLNEMYESDNYKEVITLFKEKAKEIARNKIDSLVKLFS